MKSTVAASVAFSSALSFISAEQAAPPQVVESKEKFAEQWQSLKASFDKGTIQPVGDSAPREIYEVVFRDIAFKD